MRSCSWWLIKFFQKSLLVFSLILGCNQRKDLDPERVKIPFSEPIKNLSEIASKVTYISLKDEANSFLGNLDKLILTDKYIIAGDISTKERINIYDTEGNFLSTIRNYGEGPGEFTHISDFSFDPERELVSVSLVGKVIFFDLRGNFIEEFRTDVLFKMHLIRPNGSILFYLPQQIAPEFTDTDLKGGIVFLGDLNNKSFEKILSNTFSNNLKTPYMKERSVFQVGIRGETAFSHHFNDTVYIFDKNLKLEKKILIDLGAYRMELDHFEKFDNWVDALNNYGNKALNQNNLVFDGEHLGGRLSWNGKVYHFLSNLKTKNCWLASKFTNDLDHGLEYFQIRGIKDQIIYSVHRVEELDAFLQNGDLMRSFPEDLENHSYFIAKYHLK